MPEHCIIMARGIEGSKVFRDDNDRESFLERSGGVLQETNAICYAWALIPNHFHLLLRTGSAPISTVMRRLLAGYALWCNRRPLKYFGRSNTMTLQINQ